MKRFHFKEGKLTSLIALIFITVACENRRPPAELEYEGDVHVIEDMEGIYSELGNKVVKFKSPYQATLQNEDRKYPKGIFIEFYKNESKETTLTSDSAYFQKSSSKWYIEKNVVVTNVKTQEVLSTDEMIWDRLAHKIIIDSTKKVTITTPDKIIKGEGLIADENFTNWKMFNLTGIFYSEDEID